MYGLMMERAMIPTRTRSFRVPKDVDDMIRELSIKLNISTSEVVRHAIKALYALHFK